jgi:hypothetical protein
VPRDESYISCSKLSFLVNTASSSLVCALYTGYYRGEDLEKAFAAR